MSDTGRDDCDTPARMLTRMGRAKRLDVQDGWHHVVNRGAGSRYSRYANARLGRDGALFRGRFRSIAIVTPEQLVNASVYIHRNAEDVAFQGRLREYRWSSLRWYADGTAAPPWLSQDFVLSCFGDDRARYLSDVEQGRAA